VSAEIDWQQKALEYANKLKELVVVIKEEREANRKVTCAQSFATCAPLAVV
jgi:hypothetical protein